MSNGINKIPNESNAVQNRINTQQQLSNQVRMEKSNKPSSRLQAEETRNKSPKVLSPKELKRVIDKINENVARLNKEVKFVYNETLKSLVVKVIDEKTGRVIREIPPQEVINLQKKLSEIVGIIFDSKEVEK